MYNDYNSNLVNLFWCVRNRPLALIREIGFLPLNSRQEFEVLRKFLREEEFTDDDLKEEMELCKRCFEPPEREELLELLTEKTELGDVRESCRFLQGDPVQLCRQRDFLWRETHRYPPGFAPDLVLFPTAAECGD